MRRIRLAIDPPGVREHIVTGSGDVAGVSRREIAILATRYEGHFHDVPQVGEDFPTNALSGHSRTDLESRIIPLD
jgi:hypothetical protein